MTSQMIGGVFNLKKGDTFAIDKNFERIHVGSFWERTSGGKSIDVDVHAFLLSHPGGDPQRAVLYGGGTHALTYANTLVTKTRSDEGGIIDGFQSEDGSMWHSIDNRKGGQLEIGHGEETGHEEEEISEEIILHLAQLPTEAAEIAVWATIHDATKRSQDFSMAKSFLVEMCDPDDTQLCKFQPAGEFAGMTALQVGSLMRNDDGTWEFVAIGSGSRSDLGQILQQYGA